MAFQQDASHSDNAGLSSAAPSPAAVEALIERFGGLRPMAHQLGVPVSTVQGWKKRGAIPSTRGPEIRAAMVRLNLGDPDAALENVFRHDDSQSPAPPPAPAESAPPTVETPAVQALAAEATAAESPPVEEPTVEVPQMESPPVDAALAVAAEPAPVESVSEPAPDEPQVQPPPPPEAAPPSASEPDLSAPEPSLHKPVVSQEAPVSDTPAQISPSVADDRPQGGQGAGAAIAAAVLAVIGAAVSVTAPLWSHEYLQRTVNIAVIEKRTADLDAALKGDAAARAALSDRVGAIEKTLASLEARVARAPAVAGALAVRDLRAALAAGSPFAAEALAVRASGLLGADEEALLAGLGAYSEKGVPTAAQLSERFAWVASSVAGAGLAGMLPSVPTELPSQMWSWASGVANGVAGAVSGAANSVNVSGIAEALRLKEPSPADAAPAAPTPPTTAPEPAPAAAAAPAVPQGPSPAALLAEAAGKLREGDLAAAATAVEKLEGPAAERTAPWVADARARLAADKLSAAVAQRAVKALQ